MVYMRVFVLYIMLCLLRYFIVPRLTAMNTEFHDLRVVERVWLADCHELARAETSRGWAAVIRF